MHNHIPPKPINQSECCFKYITMSTQEVHVKKFISVDAAKLWLYTCMNKHFKSSVFCNTSISKCFDYQMYVENINKRQQT